MLAKMFSISMECRIVLSTNNKLSLLIANEMICKKKCREWWFFFVCQIGYGIVGELMSDRVDRACTSMTFVS